MAAANPSVKVGDTIPQGTFAYVPFTPELEDGVSERRAFLVSRYID